MYFKEKKAMPRKKITVN